MAIQPAGTPGSFVDASGFEPLTDPREKQVSDALFALRAATTGPYRTVSGRDLAGFEALKRGAEVLGTPGAFDASKPESMAKLKELLNGLKQLGVSTEEPVSAQADVALLRELDAFRGWGRKSDPTPVLARALKRVEVLMAPAANGEVTTLNENAAFALLGRIAALTK